MGDTEMNRGSDGFTLIETLASIIILSMFVVSMITLLGGLTVESKMNEEKEYATVMARNLVVEVISGKGENVQSMPTSFTGPDGTSYAATTKVYDNGTSLAPQAGWTQTVTPYPSWANGLLYAEVRVTWQGVGVAGPTPQVITSGEGFLPTS